MMINELAENLLTQAEALIEEPEGELLLLNYLNRADSLCPDDPSILCRSARIFFRLGLSCSKREYLAEALDKIQCAYAKLPSYFDASLEWWQLWGSILVHCDRFFDDERLVEEAVCKLEKGASLGYTIPPAYYWDWGEAWVVLASKSNELSDLQQGIVKYRLAAQGGVESIFFPMAFSEALKAYSEMSGDPSFLKEGLVLLRTQISESYSPEKEPPIAYVLAWRKYAQAMKSLYDLTHSHEVFEEADRALRDAILSDARNSDLWLDWGELYLQAGWLKRDLVLVRDCLEKLTAPKVKECHPLKVSVLQGLALVVIGVYCENLKPLLEGKERVKTSLELAPEYPPLQAAAAFAELGLGLYFLDEAYYAQAATLFEKMVQKGGDLPFYIHSLFQTYLGWGIQSEDPKHLQTAIELIARLSLLRPFSPIYLNEWGIALLRLRQLEESPEKSQAYIEEAIDKFKKAYALDREDDTLYHLGCALDLLGDATGNEEDYEKAIEVLSMVFERAPQEPHICYRLGLALSHLGEITLNADNLVEGIRLLESVAQTDQEDEAVWCDLGYAYLNLSELVWDAEYPEEGDKIRCLAEKALIKAIELGSGDGCYHLACLYSLTGHFKSSVQFLIKADEKGYLPEKEELENDTWLDNVRNSESFINFLRTEDQNQDG